SILNMIVFNRPDIKPLWYARRRGHADQKPSIRIALVLPLDDHVTYKRRVHSASLAIGLQTQKRIVGIVRTDGPVMVKQKNAVVSGIVSSRASWLRSVRQRHRLDLLSRSEKGHCKNQNQGEGDFQSHTTSGGRGFRTGLNSRLGILHDGWSRGVLLCPLATQK